MRTTINLAASTTGKKVQTADEILKQIESTLPDVSQQSLAQRGGPSASLQGRINEHQLTYGDNALPRSRLPKVDNALLDRYQAARHNVLVLGAIQQAESKSKSNTHRSNRSGKGGGRTPHAAGSRTPHAPGSHTPAATRPSSHRAAPHHASAGEAGDADDADGDGDDGAWGSLLQCADPSNASAGGGGLQADASGGGLESAFNSFKSRVSSKRLGSIAEDALSAQPSGASLHGEESSHRTGRRFNRQGSNTSMASRASGASFASGLTGVSGASGFTAGASSAGSCYGGSRQLGQQSSYHSSAGSSGHTLRSGRAGSVAGSSYGGHYHHHHKKGAKKKPPKPEPGRVTRAFAEFGGSDWVSKTVLKHTLAAIIQARWRGYYVRQRWKVNREQLVIDEKARLEAATAHQARLQDLQHKLLLYQQKKLAQAAAEAAAAAAADAPDASSGDGDAAGGVGASAAAANGGVSLGIAAGGGGSGPHVGVSRAVSSAWQSGLDGQRSVASWQSMRLAGEPSYPVAAADGYGSSDSDSGWSDVELDAVAAIKFRAVTPPWQRAPDRQQMSLQLQQRTAAAAAAALGIDAAEAAACWADGLAGMGSCWDGDDNNTKLQELRHRRICRKPEPVPLSAPAIAAAAAAGLLTATAAAAASGGGGDGDNDAAAAAADGPSGASEGAAVSGEAGGSGGAAAGCAGALPQYIVEALLLERYSGKYARLGLPHKMPGRQRWLKMQAENAAAIAATATAGEEGAESDVAAGGGVGGSASETAEAAVGVEGGAVVMNAQGAAGCVEGTLTPQAVAVATGSAAAAAAPAKAGGSKSAAR